MMQAGDNYVLALTEADADRMADYASALGAADGRAAASWYLDGSTPDATYRATLRGIEAGDPAILDELPQPDLSGQWAGTLTGPGLVDAALAYINVTVSADDAANMLADLCDLYEGAFSVAAEDEVARVCRYHLAD